MNRAAIRRTLRILRAMHLRWRQDEERLNRLGIIMIDQEWDSPEHEVIRNLQTSIVQMEFILACLENQLEESK